MSQLATTILDKRRKQTNITFTKGGSLSSYKPWLLWNLSCEKNISFVSYNSGFNQSKLQKDNISSIITTVVIFTWQSYTGSLKIISPLPSRKSKFETMMTTYYVLSTTYRRLSFFYGKWWLKYFFTHSNECLDIKEGSTSWCVRRFVPPNWSKFFFRQKSGWKKYSWVLMMQ